MDNKYNHIIKNTNGQYACKCGKKFKSIGGAMKHSSVFDNTPNAAALMAALRLV